MTPRLALFAFTITIALAGRETLPAAETPLGFRIAYGTYLGGSKQERNVYGLAIDRAGNIVFTTATRSPDAPTTPGCFQGRFGGGPSDMLVAKLNPDLTRILWCTYVGRGGDDFPRGGLALDAQDNVCVVGTSASANFPTTPGVLQPRRHGPRDSALVKLKADGSGLVFSTLLGGSGEDDAIMGARFDGEGNIHLAGHTRSTDFPVTPGAAQPRSGGRSDCYLATLSADATRLMQATYLGGRGDDLIRSLALGPAGEVYLVGSTSSDDFPITDGAFQKAHGGKGDAFLVKLVPAQEPQP